MPENDLDQVEEKLQSMGDSAKWVLAIIKDLRAEVTNQKEALSIAQQQGDEARAAEKEARRKYGEALELKEGQYSELISDLFEKPKEELARKVQRWSKIGLFFTALVSIGAIVFTTIVSVDTRRELEQLSLSIREATKNVDVQMRLHALSSKDVMEIRGFLGDNQSRHKALLTTNGVALAYLIDLVNYAGPKHYDFYIGAFLLHDISIEAMPTRKDLRQWDSNIIRLYERWNKELMGKRGVIPKGSIHRQFNTFSSRTDRIRYGGWEFDGKSLTYERLREIIGERKEKHLQQLKLNVLVSG